MSDGLVSYDLLSFLLTPLGSFFSLQPLPTADQIAAMSVRELKELLTQHNISAQGCVEKADLQAKARALLEGSAVPPAAPTSGSAEEMKSGIPAAERTENGSAGTGGEDADEAEKKESRMWGVVDRKVDGLPSEWRSTVRRSSFDQRYAFYGRPFVAHLQMR